MPGWPKSWKICWPGAEQKSCRFELCCFKSTLLSDFLSFASRKRSWQKKLADCFSTNETACDHDRNWMWELFGLRFLKREPSILMAAKAILKHKRQRTHAGQMRKASNCIVCLSHMRSKYQSENRIKSVNAILRDQWSRRPCVSKTVPDPDPAILFLIWKYLEVTWSNMFHYVSYVSQYEHNGFPAVGAGFPARHTPATYRQFVCDRWRSQGSGQPNDQSHRGNTMLKC